MAPNDCKRIKRIVQEALLDAGYHCDLSGGTYSEQTVRFTVEVFEDRTEAAKEEWHRVCAKFRLSRDLFGKTFKNGEGEDFVIDGISVRARKYPVLATKVKDGKRYKFPATMVRAAV